MGVPNAQDQAAAFRLEDHLFFHFSQILARRTRALNARLRSHGLDYSRWRVLAVLQENAGATMGRLADLTSVDRTTLTRTLGLMEAAELIVRRERDDDRRSVAISLTAKGRRLFARILPLALVETDRALSGFSPREAADLRDKLKRMADNLSVGARSFELDYDRAYANAPFIAGADAYPARWARDAAAFRAALGPRARTGIAYGPGARQRLDLFLPELAPRGLFVFIHGGYWIKYDRDLWSHLAAGALARQWACALPSYTLAPEARIGAMTLEIARAIEVAAGLAAGPVVVSGHSAGGHLSARMGCADVALSVPVKRVAPISPLADLEPLSLTAMNASLQLDAPEIAAESPARRTRRPGVEAHVWVGAQERPAFLWQARLLAEAWNCPWTPESGRHHFDIIDGLTDPASPLMSACLES